ncbi:MAG: hypothetical protein WCF92_02370 [bacterium]
MYVKKETKKWLLLVANFVAENFSFDEAVELVYPISIEKEVIEMEAMTRNHRYFMMVWLDQKGVPFRGRIVFEGKTEEMEIFSSLEGEIGI